VNVGDHAEVHAGATSEFVIVSNGGGDASTEAITPVGAKPVAWEWVSPKRGFFQPPKEWYAVGTGTSMPTVPTSTSFWNCRAAPPSSLVKMAVPLPNWLERVSR
jgi:hypothetical protein